MLQRETLPSKVTPNSLYIPTKQSAQQDKCQYLGSTVVSSTIPAVLSFSEIAQLEGTILMGDWTPFVSILETAAGEVSLSVCKSAAATDDVLDASPLAVEVVSAVVDGASREETEGSSRGTGSFSVPRVDAFSTLSRANFAYWTHQNDMGNN